LGNEQTVINQKINKQRMKKRLCGGIFELNIPQFFQKIIFTLLLASFTQLAQAQSGTVSGKVLDSNKEPIIGATIEVIDAFKKNIGGTTTDLDGNYSIEVKDLNLSSLKISFLGYKTQTIAIKGSTTIDAKLDEDSEVLEEVVAIGYQNQTKPRVSSSIASVGEKEMKLTNNASLENALQGRAAGVQVTQQSGRPGSISSVRVRGAGSPNGTEPLYVIDGVPVTADALNLLNPNDIQSMDVLKDAASAAIYGTRGSNGVVMITTKRGKAGRMSLNFDGSAGVTQVWKKLNLLDNTQYMSYLNSLYGSGLTTAGQSGADYYKSDNPNLNNNVDWQKQTLQNGYIQNYNLSLAGGNEKAIYAISGGYFNQKGNIVHTGFERYSLRVNSEYKPKKWLTIGENLAVSRTYEDLERGGLLEFARMPPIYPVFDQNGNFTQTTESTSGRYDFANPAAFNASFETSNRLAYRMLGSVYGEVQLLKKLKYKLNFGFDYTNSKNQNVRNPFNPGARGNIDTKGLISRTASDGRDYLVSPLIENTIIYSDTIGKKHDYSILVGTSQQEFYRNQVNTVNSRMSPGITNTSFRSAGQVTGGVEDILRLRGYLARINYAFDGKYLLTLNARYDGSSKFPTNNKYALFPSASVGWRLMEEKFMQNIPFMKAYFTDIKLRGSWGLTGNQEGLANTVKYAIFNDKPEQSLGSTSTTTPTVYNISTPASIANPNIKWEAVKQTNVGLDISMFKNRLSFVADYFIKSSDGLIVFIPVPHVIGVRAEGDANPGYWTNLGNIVNKGFEFSTTYRKDEGEFKYSIGANISRITNNIESLGGQGNYISTTYTRSQEGGPLGGFFGYEYLGVVRNSEDVKYTYSEKNYVPVVGDALYMHGDDNLLTPIDRKVIGSPIPKLVYGVNASADYKGFDLRVFIQGVYGNQIYNQMRAELEKMSGTGPQVGNQLSTVADRWTPENPNGSLPRATFSDRPADHNNLVSSRFVEYGSFVRLKSVQLGYSLPSDKLKTWFKSDTDMTLRIYISGQNLITITNYSGYDPEVGSVLKANTNVPDPLQSGVDNGNYPQPRTYMCGIQFGF
jgi:TonB-linked SusC/RagA family outer membrane protein